MAKKHLALEANTARTSWKRHGEIGWFEPNGPLRVYTSTSAELRPNRELWSDAEPLHAARIIVGFNVEDKPRWDLDDVVDIVRRVREQQTGNPSSTFVMQRGIYAHTEKAGHDRQVVDEKGAQIILLNTPDMETGTREFQHQMVELAEVLATELLQESVILELQKGGIVQKTIGVGPEGDL